MKDAGDNSQSSQRIAQERKGQGKGRGLVETGNVGRTLCASGGQEQGVGPAGGSGRGGSWVPFGRSRRQLSVYHCLGPNSRKEKRWEGQKAELGGNGGAEERAALGAPR